MLIALLEIDGATNPTVFAGRHGLGGCKGCALLCKGSVEGKAMSPCHERVAVLAEKTLRLANLRKMGNAGKKVGIVLFGFPPNAGASTLNGLSNASDVDIGNTLIVTNVGALPAGVTNNEIGRAHV